MQPISVVLDTNIAISAAISTDGAPAKIFELLLEGKITKEIIDELEDVIRRPAFKKCIDDEYREFVLNDLKKNSVSIKSAFDEDAVKDDRKDNKFVNCALSANATIISGDKHLLKLKRYRGTRMISARELLELFKKTKT